MAEAEVDGRRKKSFISFISFVFSSDPDTLVRQGRRMRGSGWAGWESVDVLINQILGKISTVSDG